MRRNTSVRIFEKQIFFFFINDDGFTVKYVPKSRLLTFGLNCFCIRKLSVDNCRVLCACSFRGTVKDPDGHDFDRVEDVFEIRGQERQLDRDEGRVAERRTLRVLVHSAGTEQGMLRNDRLPPGPRFTAHDEPGGAPVPYLPGHHTARAFARGRATPRTGSVRP